MILFRSKLAHPSICFSKAWDVPSLTHLAALVPVAGRKVVARKRFCSRARRNPSSYRVVCARAPSVNPQAVVRANSTVIWCLWVVWWISTICYVPCVILPIHSTAQEMETFFLAAGTESSMWMTSWPYSVHSRASLRARRRVRRARASLISRVRPPDRNAGMAIRLAPTSFPAACRRVTVTPRAASTAGTSASVMLTARSYDYSHERGHDGWPANASRMAVRSSMSMRPLPPHGKRSPPGQSSSFEKPANAQRRSSTSTTPVGTKSP